MTTFELLPPTNNLKRRGTPRIRALIDLHYALQPFSGISQETRLMFGELASATALQLGGLVNMQADLWTAHSRRGFDSAADDA